VKSREFLALVVAGLLAAEVAAADIYALARVKRQGSPRPQCDSFTATENQGVGAGCDIPADSGFDPVHGTAFAQALYGSLHTRARLSSENSDGRSWEAAGYASFSDTLRISAPGKDGEGGAADIVVRTHASNVTQRDALSAGTLSAISELTVSMHGRIVLFHTLSGQEPLFTGRVFFVYGRPFEFGLGLESKVKCTLCEGSWNGMTDASESAVLEIIEVEGLEPREFSLLSTLGYEYANIVPEPAAALQHGIALGALGVLLRRRGRAGRIIAHRSSASC